MIPLNTELGTLEIIEVYDFYDFPRLFSCQNKIDQKYIAYCKEENIDDNIFLYLPVSDIRFKNIRSGGISIRNAFQLAEEKYIFLITFFRDSTQKIEKISSSALNAEWFPPEDYSLELETNTIFNNKNYDEKIIAEKSWKDTINLIFHYPKINRTESPIRGIGDVLLAIQDLMDALGQFNKSIPTTKGPISKNILDETQLNLAQIFPGSFGIQLKASKTSNLFGRSLVRDSVKKMIELINIKTDKERLNQLMHELKGRVGAKYVNFLNSVLKTDADFDLKWGSPYENDRESLSLSREEIQEVLRIAEEIQENSADEIIIKAVLIGINVRTKSYEILGVEDKRKYAGRISETALEEASKATISKQYDAKLKQIIEVHSITGEEKYKWILIGLYSSYSAQTE